MAVDGTIIIPDKGMDKFLPLIRAASSNLINDDIEIKIKNLVISSEIKTLNLFNGLNMFVSLYGLNRLALKANDNIFKFINRVTNLGNKILNTNYNVLDGSYDDVVVDSVTKNSKVSDDIYIDTTLLTIYKRLMEDRNNDDIIDIFKDTYTIPISNGTLLIVVVDQDKTLKLVNTISELINRLYSKKLTNGNLIVSSYLVIRLIFNDIVKNTIANQPGIGDVIIDTDGLNMNKSYGILFVD